MTYSKAIAKEERARRLKLENMQKILENNLTDNVKKLHELLKFEVNASITKKEKNPVRGSPKKIHKFIASNDEITDPPPPEKKNSADRNIRCINPLTICMTFK